MARHASVGTFALPAILLLAFAAAPSVSTAGGIPDSTPPAVADAATVGPQQQLLAVMAGHWSVRQSFWKDPDAAPAVDHGTAIHTLVLGGRRLYQQLEVPTPTPFEGLGYSGYDNVTGRHYRIWMDTNFTGLLVTYGDYDIARKTYTFTGALPSSGSDGKALMIPVREVVHVEDRDHFTFDAYETRNGREALIVRLEYTRAE